MMPRLFGGLEQAAHVFSNSFAGLFVFWLRHEALCSVVDILMQGVVEDIEMKQESFVFNGFPVCSGLKCTCFCVQDVFKGVHENIDACVIQVISQLLCDANNAMREHAQCIV